MSWLTWYVISKASGMVGFIGLSTIELVLFQYLHQSFQAKLVKCNS